MAMEETYRRRAKQTAHNTLNNITPRGVIKPVRDIIDGIPRSPTEKMRYARVAESLEEYNSSKPGDWAKLVLKLEKKMYAHAKNLELNKRAQSVIKLHIFVMKT